MTSLAAKNVHLARYDTLTDRECGSVAAGISNPEYRRTPGTFQIVTVDAARRWIEAGAPVAGICGATVCLAQSGLLDDRAHTSSAPEQLATTGYRGAQHYVDAAAVTDRNVITAGAESPV